VHADASGIDRLIARPDDDLRRCWKLAVRIVDAGRPVAPPPSCRALRVSELRLSAGWLARCRRFEAGNPSSRPVVAKPAHRVEPFARAVLARGGFVPDSDQDGVPDFRDRCPEEPGDDASTDGCPHRTLRRGVALEHVIVLGGLPLQTPAMPPYDLTPAAQTVCVAVQDVVAHWTATPNPTIPLALAQRWSAGRFEIEWPVESTVSPVEDALRACLHEWSLDIATASDMRNLRWQKAGFLVELRTAPAPRLVIAKP
jgi:hypothetical protein